MYQHPGRIYVPDTVITAFTYTYPMDHRKKGPKPKQYNTEYVSKAASETVLA